MSPMMIFLMTCTLVGNMVLAGQPAAGPGVTLDDRASVLPAWSQQSPGAPLWTTWGANNYALADDGVSIWIGGTGSVVRWDKAQGSYRRYSAVDGLPHTKVLAVAVDAAGSRWFGGDGGLSRLDVGENWTHLGSDNSGLYSDQVAAIAVVGGDTLYLSHGLPGGSVSRLDSDGAWRWFPNRETAIQADYDTIVQARASTALWTVAGDEIWAGSQVFDGERWHERKLPSSPGEPVSLAVDSRNHVWALSSGWTVYEWAGSGWLAHRVDLSFSGQITALAVDSDDKVWIGLQERGQTPYSSETAVVRELLGAHGSSLAVSGPVTALLSTPEGLWGVGPGWLMLPDLTATVLADGPRFQDLPDASLGGDGLIWLYSGSHQGYSVGAVQTLDDRGTLALEDDTWQVRPTDYLPGLGHCELVTAFERAASDFWYTSFCQSRFPWDHKAVRYYGGQRIEYPLPVATMFEPSSDIFAQDPHHIWFATWGNKAGNVLSLDDGGTPADTSDDVWQTFPIEAVEGRVVVAIDANGHLWHGQGSGLYRHDGSSWQLIYGERPVCDLVPAADGTLYAQVAAYGDDECEEHSERVLVVGADGSIEGTKYLRGLVEDELATVRTARRRNSLWAVASDGAVWYVADDDAGQHLQRRSSSGLLTYPLPVEPEAVQRLEVDARGRVWLVADSQLWRMEGPVPIRLYLPAALR